MSSRFIHVVTYDRISFFFKAVCPLCIYTTFCLPLHPPMDTWVAFTFWLLWTMLLWTCIYKYLFEIMLSVLLNIYPEAVLQDHMAALFLIFSGTTTLFFIVATPVYIPTNTAPGFQFLHILANTCYFLSLFVNLFLYSSHPDECEVVFHCGFDLHFPHDFEHLFIYLLLVLHLQLWLHQGAPFPLDIFVVYSLTSFKSV